MVGTAEKVLGDRHPDCLRYNMEFASFLIDAGEISDRLTLRPLRQSGRNRPVDCTDILLRPFAGRELRNAFDIARKARDSAIELLGHRHPVTLELTSVMGKAYTALGAATPYLNSGFSVETLVRLASAEKQTFQQPINMIDSQEKSRRRILS